MEGIVVHFSIPLIWTSKI